MTCSAIAQVGREKVEKYADPAVRLYNIGVAALVAYDLAERVWKLYSATNPAAFIATEFAKTCLFEFKDHIFDIGVHLYRSTISKNSHTSRQAEGIALDLARIGNIVGSIISEPYSSSVPLKINKVDIFNHGMNLACTAFYSCFARPKNNF